MTSRRLPALILLLALVAGGLGLPIADTLIYHTRPIATPATPTDDIAVCASASALHLQGCVLWLSGSSGSGVAAKSPAFAVTQVAARVPALSSPQPLVALTDIALGYSRAPPVA